jgi:hypothetical protein
MNQVTAHEYTMEDLQKLMLGNLKFAQRNFNKNPNSLRWIVTVRAMFIFQQVDAAMRMPHFDQQALLESLQGVPYLQWDDMISTATTGMNMRDALKTFA